MRVELCFTGCCDPSLGLRIDTMNESDIVIVEGDVTFVISMETCKLAGDITISLSNDKDKKRFIISSSNTVSEWDGFISCEIKV